MTGIPYSYFTNKRCTFGACRGKIACYVQSAEGVNLRTWECLQCGREARPAQMLGYHGEVVAVQRNAIGENGSMWLSVDPYNTVRHAAVA